MNPVSYNELLAVATSAKGTEPMDKTIQPMTKENQEWIEKALHEQTKSFDPIQRLKVVLARLKTILSTFHQNTDEVALFNTNDQKFEELRILIEECLIDLICDLDLAADFCKIGGLEVVKKFLHDSHSPRVSSLFLFLISELSQHNPKVQEYFVRDEYYLNYCLNILNINTDTTEIADDTTKYKALGAISSIVKAYIPGIVKFVRFNGTEIFKAFFENALQNNNTKLVFRSTVVAKSISNSFSEKLANDMKVADLFTFVREKLESIPGNQFQDSLNYISE